ncbi:MAG: UDP-N-acetylmuramate dehydrogenase [Elusimicrobia bacterium]|nr:UDP-N-acetylmuramate dehydrogenase [Elusimicrobiota bacterium]MBD3411758.1 UDP-N-acetylmuramate dehydrogenase [Elusimicrobiota bacterium]
MASVKSLSVIKKKLKNILKKRVFYDIPFSELTSYRVGGSVAVVMYPRSCDELSRSMPMLRDSGIPRIVIGNGTNILASDDGYKGVVICLKKMSSITHSNTIIECEAGLDLDELIVYSIRHNLAGLQHLSGIPGTVGGALWMNAGAYESEISDTLVGIELMDYAGRVIYMPKKSIDFSYRKTTNIMNKIIIKAWFKLIPARKSDLMRTRKKIIGLRHKNQPWRAFSAGSVFQRPKGTYASLLIERAGLKGYRIGGAEVSRKHAGFIINTGTATSRDIRALIKYVQNEIYRNYKVKLKLEQVLID